MSFLGLHVQAFTSKNKVLVQETFMTTEHSSLESILQSQKETVISTLSSIFFHNTRVSSYRMAQKYRIIGHFFPKYRTNIGHFFPKYRTNMIK